MSNLIDQTELREIFSSVLSDIGIEGILRHHTDTYVGHTRTGSTPTDYPVFYVSPGREIIEVVRGGQRESIETEKIICQADGLGEAPPTYPDSTWTFVDALGASYTIIMAKPTRPEITTIVFTLYVVR
jgi:hypothetical protein